MRQNKITRMMTPFPLGIYFHESHGMYIDHLLPLSGYFSIPLITTSRFIESIAKEQYQNVNTIYIEKEALIEHLSLYQTLITPMPKDVIDILFFPKTVTAKLIWTPHGNSDKGIDRLYIEGLERESHLFVYGKTMIDFFSQKINLSNKKLYCIGDYRKKYCDNHHVFYSKLLKERLPKKGSKKRLLYAPSWHESSFSYESAEEMKCVIKMSETYDILLKLHPNMIKDETSALLLRGTTVTVLNDFMPIYPLIESVDIYIGDTSSIGYDVLSKQIPMLFIHSNERLDSSTSLPLFQHGIITKVETLEQDILTALEVYEKYKEKQLETYHNTFSSNIDPIQSLLSL